MKEYPQPAGGIPASPDWNVSPDTACTMGSPCLEVGVWPYVPEAAVGDVYDVGLDLHHLVVGEAPAIQHALAEVLGDDIADRNQFAQDVAGLRLSHIESDAHLLHIVVVEGAAEIDSPALVRPWPIAPEDVPLPLPEPVFDADDLRPEHGQRLSSAGAGELSGKIADAYLGQSLALSIG